VFSFNFKWKMGFLTGKMKKDEENGFFRGMRGPRM